MNEFVVQYDKVVTARREAEEGEDFLTMNTHASLSGIHPVKEDIQDLLHTTCFPKISSGIRREQQLYT